MRVSKRTSGGWNKKSLAPATPSINVKEGIGGIRDVEFTVQLMQLIAGGANPACAAAIRFSALEALADAGLLTKSESARLAESYLFLRNVEHRLQLRDELPVRTLPIDPGEMRPLRAASRLRRRRGVSCRLPAAHSPHTRAVHAPVLRLRRARPCRRPLSDWVLAPDDDPPRGSRCGRRWQSVALPTPDAALRSLRRSVSGSQYGGISPEARAAFAAFVPALLDAAGHTADPDTALHGLDLLADAVPSRAALYRTLTESQTLLPRLAVLAAGQPLLCGRCCSAIWSCWICSPMTKQWMPRRISGLPARVPSSPRSRAAPGFKPAHGICGVWQTQRKSWPK